MSRTKIETHLTPEGFREFCMRAAQLKGTKLSDIQALAAEFDIEVSLMGARSFRKGPFADYLVELNAKREMAENITAVSKSGLAVSDAAAAVLTAKVFDRLVNADQLTDDETDQMSLALSRLRSGDQRARLLEAKLEEMAREKTEWEEQRQKIVEQTNKLRTATGKNADEVRAQVVAEIDKAMGITPQK